MSVGSPFTTDRIFSEVGRWQRQASRCQQTSFSRSDTIKPGLLDLSSRILGPNSVTQAALPRMLTETPASYYEDILHQLQVRISPSLDARLSLIFVDQRRIFLQIFARRARPSSYNATRSAYIERTFRIGSVTRLLFRCDVHADRHHSVRLS